MRPRRSRSHAVREDFSASDHLQVLTEVIQRAGPGRESELLDTLVQLRPFWEMLSAHQPSSHEGSPRRESDEEASGDSGESEGGGGEEGGEGRGERRRGTRVR